MLRVFRGGDICSIIPRFRQHLVNRRRYSYKFRDYSLVFNNEVSAARKNDVPIVALESTIITHGMPYPDNLETALRVENVIREQVIMGKSSLTIIFTLLTLKPNLKYKYRRGVLEKVSGSDTWWTISVL